jgi:hypothetical protein
MSINESLAALGFAPEAGDDEEHPDLFAYTDEGFFTVKVVTHAWHREVLRWKEAPDPFLRGETIKVAAEVGEESLALDPPQVSLYLGHSCDEWVVADAHCEDPAAVAKSFARAAQQGAALLEQALAVVSTEAVRS